MSRSSVTLLSYMASYLVLIGRTLISSLPMHQLSSSKAALNEVTLKSRLQEGMTTASRSRSARIQTH
ncbi:BgTH12-05046 [Blumeria graminis f. sp. triticale]|uniref:BgTH12-05046 n=1 Tax=Blumeria graminis f. sp. triticale TaxID=1689686 RepID=A0A9W4DIM8_BLUGR|nr:BgTH12-05046 [Blumeria graminis f. sp. triticale]